MPAFCIENPRAKMEALPKSPFTFTPDEWNEIESLYREYRDGHEQPPDELGQAAGFVPVRVMRRPVVGVLLENCTTLRFDFTRVRDISDLRGRPHVAITHLLYDPNDDPICHHSSREIVNKASCFCLRPMRERGLIQCFCHHDRRERPDETAPRPNARHHPTGGIRPVARRAGYGFSSAVRGGRPGGVSRQHGGQQPAERAAGVRETDVGPERATMGSSLELEPN